MNEGALPELPGGWVWTRLEDIAEKINPGFPSGKHNKESQGVPHLRPMNINVKGEIDFSVVKYVQTGSYDSLLRGDILFNNTNSPELLGKTAYIKKDTNWAYSNHMTRIRLNKSFLNSAWISYYLHNLFLRGFFKMSCTHHVNQASINSTFLSQKVPIPLPPLPEQRRIVAKIEELFTKLDAGVETLKKTQAGLKRYRQSVLKAACEGKLVPTEAELACAEGRDYEPADVLLARILKERREKSNGAKYKEPAAPDTNGLPVLPEGWVWSSFGLVFNIYVGATPSRKRPDYWGGQIPWVSSGEVAFCKIFQTKETITDLGLTNSSTVVHPSGTVLLGMIGEGKTRGQAAILEIAACNNQNSAAIRVSEIGLPPEYIFYFLEGEYEHTRTMGSGNNQQALNKSRVQSMFFPLPPLAEQYRIVLEVERRLSIADGVERTVEQSIRQAERLRQSILKKAFQGRLVEQDERDEPAGVLLERIKEERAHIGERRRGRDKNVV